MNKKRGQLSIILIIVLMLIVTVAILGYVHVHKVKVDCLGGEICSATQTCNGSVDLTSQRMCCSGNCVENIINQSNPSNQTFSGDFLDSPFGFNPVRGEFEAAEDMGIRWERGGGSIGWDLIQPDIDKNEYKFKHSPGKLSEENIDQEMVAEASHFKLWVNIDSAPIESRTGAQRYVHVNGNHGTDIAWTPLDEQKFKNYIKKVVERYDGDSDYGCVVSAPDCYVIGDDEYPTSETISIFENNPAKYWDIGNEAGSNPQNAFANYIKISSTAIKEADPSAKVVGCGAPTGGPEISYINFFNTNYLPTIQALRGGYIDGYDFHWYGKATGDYRLIDYATGEDVYDYIRTKLTENGFPSDFPIWIGEMGSFSGSMSAGKGGDYPPQTEQQQAGDYVKRYVYPLSLGVGKIFPAWGLKEGFNNDNTYFDHTGFIYDGLGSNDLGNGVKKLSYYSYKKMTEKLEGSNWNNIQTVSGLPANVYAYKFVKNNKSLYVLWWDYWNEPTATTKNVNLPVSFSGNAKIIEAVPKYETGQEVTNYATAFNGGVVASNNGQITISLGQSPVYIEETIDSLLNYVPHVWLPPANNSNPQNSCGNGICSSSETIKSCPADCSGGTSSCGDGICDGAAGEKQTCPADCPPISKK